MQIAVFDKIEKGFSLVMIGKKNSVFDKTLFKNEEHQYLKKAIGKGEKSIIFNRYGSILVVVIPDEKKSGHELIEGCRKVGAKIADITSKHKIEKIQVTSISQEADQTMACAEGIILASYRFTKYLTKADDKKSALKEIRLISKCIEKKDIEELKILTVAVCKARDLINEPVNHLNPLQLAKEMEKTCKEAGISIQVLGKKQIETLRMGGLLAVNKGSVDPPTFSIMEWKPKNAVNKKPIVLVGKGIVYDTGGLSLKPTQDSMDYMKSDMSGAAAVAGAMYAIAKNNLPVYAVALVPSTDNRPGFNAYAPGDIIRMFDGTTVENMNSDAEGRMILADAISYSKKYNPELLINVATLTGSAAIAVGPHAMVSMGTASIEVMGKLKESGERVGERMVEFPLWDEYSEMLKSDIADIRNVGGRSAGAILGGKFLEKFAPCPFIHLDIAGVAFNKAFDSYKPKGGVGVCVRLLYDFAKQYATKTSKRK
jgi:leucyl aminopeptidase